MLVPNTLHIHTPLQNKAYAQQAAGSGKKLTHESDQKDTALILLNSLALFTLMILQESTHWSLRLRKLLDLTVLQDLPDETERTEMF